jgi:protein gp37
VGDSSNIEWTDATWNPLAGCTPVSEGCLNCYAAGMALRLEAMGQAKYAGTAKRVSTGRAVFTGVINMDDANLTLPFRWKRPRRIFVNSMSDLFHESVTDRQIDQIYTVMESAPWHTFQVLTKRAQRMAEYTNRRYSKFGPRHIWHGVSTEHQKAADERIPHLCEVPSPIRFLSMEPLLGPVNIDRAMYGDPVGRSGMNAFGFTDGCGYEAMLQWVIAGGESGPKARPPNPDWFRSIRDQCVVAGVPFFFKQHGEWAEPETVSREQWTEHHDYVDGTYMMRVGKKAAGRLLDGRTWDQVPS